MTHRSPEETRMEMRYRKKPVVIEAFQLGEAWPDWWADAVTANKVTTHNNDTRWRGGPDYALITTLEGQMRAEKGDWIIRGVKGEIYPCKPDIFAATYESASAPTPPTPGEMDTSDPVVKLAQTIVRNAQHPNFNGNALQTMARWILSHAASEKLQDAAQTNAASAPSPSGEGQLPMPPVAHAAAPKLGAEVAEIEKLMAFPRDVIRDARGIDKGSLAYACYQAAEKALALLRSGAGVDRDASGWLPIESAPRDGTRMLLSHGHVGRWSKYRWAYEIDTGKDRASEFPPPTHWMPLPSPPQILKSSTADTKVGD